MNTKHSKSSANEPEWLQKLVTGIQNALEVARVGRLSEAAYEPYTEVHRGSVYRLRRYEGNLLPEAVRPLAPIILVPPLMLTAEIYDISPESSAVGFLTERGVDTYVVDFGAPENEEGGLTRTLDDHVLAVSEVVDVVRKLTGQDVHLAGYSQGGMFCYQCAAYRRSQGIRSLITFGSPVNVHLNLPGVNADTAVRLLDAVKHLFRQPLEMAESIPATLSSKAFRLISARKEVRQLVDFIRNLHDREAITRGEASRLYLHGDGFVAWPGPAMRSFFEQFVVENRLNSGGFVVAGRALTLSDIRCPVLYFLGLNDDFARPPAVRAIRECAPDAPTYEASLRAGHFGLVVGSKSMRFTWPTLVQWLLWQEEKSQRPEALAAAHADGSGAIEEVEDAKFEDFEYNLSLLFDTAKDSVAWASRRLRRVAANMSSTVDNMRWQVPRLAKLERIDSDTRISVGLELSEQARRIGDHTFFLWHGRAHTYADADRRVDYVTRGLMACGVKPGDRVGVLMRVRPTYLTAAAAINRLGAVSVLINPQARRVTIDAALRMVPLDHMLTDPDHVQLARDSFEGNVLVLGGGAQPRRLIDGVIDMERIDPESVTLPAWYEPNPGKASDLAMILFSSGADDQPRAARITNRRWAVAAYGAAAASTLTSSDTVYCCMPLHHAAGLLVSVGGALSGGARLALAESFSPFTFWRDVRRYGASVVYYAGEMCRELVDAPPSAADLKNPIRLFAGSGMRMDLWQRVRERFDVSVLEFYATTEGNAVLANVSGQPVGCLGVPLPGSTEMMVAVYDFETEDVLRDAEGWVVPSRVDQPGMLLARIDSVHPLSSADGALADRARVVRDAFVRGDAWAMTGDILRTDARGEYWFVDRASEMIRTGEAPLSTTLIEDALYGLFELQRAVVYGLPLPGSESEMVVATVVVRKGYTLDPHALSKYLERKLPSHARPVFIRLREEVPMSIGYRPQKRRLRAEGLSPDDRDVLAYEPRTGGYVRLTPDNYRTAVAARQESLRVPRERKLEEPNETRNSGEGGSAA